MMIRIKYLLVLPVGNNVKIVCKDSAVSTATLTSERILLCLKFHKIRPLVLLIRVVLSWRRVWSIDGIMLTGKNDILDFKLSPFSVCCIFSPG